MSKKAEPRPSRRETIAELPRLIITVVTALTNHVRAAFERAGIELTPDQFSLMDIIMYADKPLTLTELAAIQERDKSGAMRQVDLLERQGLLERTVSSEDRRKKVLTPTAKGRRLYAKSKACVEAVMAELCTELSDERLEQVVRGLAKFSSSQSSSGGERQ
ncbi:MarR family transcriptional regulator [Pseudenhygromyxa sp. WMMC2535]|uniref:MarR family winged helix-turn-helix transcriptional regulator n=1 Tax=Pseudenhygromyxa sp. WMMC2535 TaxID=2712867 RepID=UPI0015578A04|nr:MarR family transcriptional regulator [Pseudenhygromyxa sp. WMMC2535]NVB40981.1 MarR family transcriptional regulator [Pseudenhygromyxa sp. WMMC2535]